MKRHFGIILYFSLLIVLIAHSILHAQSVASTPSNASLTADHTPAAQAPDEMTKKITDLVHAGKYLEAEKLTEGLLIAYPDDQRLIKAKTLIENALTPVGSASAAPGSSQLAAHSDVENLNGMERVEFSTLILLARQALQETDLAEQQMSLEQFMDRSTSFLEKHPKQMMIWQLRAQAALSLNEPIAGYEAGQRLISAGAAESNDPSLQQLLAQLNKKQWFNKGLVQDEAPQDRELEARESWTDQATGKMWAKKDNGSDVNWLQAANYCRNLQLAGHSGWRLPTIDELHGIYDPSTSTAGLRTGAKGIPDAWHVKGNLKLSGWHWSRSPGNASGEVWAFGFDDGGRNSIQLDDGDSKRALCVRQSGD
jgi:hypothetical protein